MLIDYMFSNGQAITASAASTNIRDLGAHHADTPALAQRGGNARVFASVTAAFNTLTSLTIALQCDSDENFGSPKTLRSVSVALADLVVGKVIFDEPIPAVPGGTERYLRLYYTVVGSNPSTGKIFAAVVADGQTNGMK